MKPIMSTEVKLAINATIKNPLVNNLVHGVATDSRGDLTDKLFFAIPGKNLDGHDFLEQAVTNGAAGLVVEKDITISQSMRDRKVNVYKVDNSIEALGRLAKYYRSKHIATVQIIAVTGSNGKTTTREMICHVLSRRHKGTQSQKNFNNAIGAPLSILEIENHHEFAVIELGSNAPGEINYLSLITQPDISVITSIGPSHLEGFKTISGVCIEKTAIAHGMRPGGVVICNGANTEALSIIDHLGCKKITFGFDPACNLWAGKIVPDDKGGISFETNDRVAIHLSVPGRHNVSNALAALAACRRMDITTADFAELISDFSAVGGRLNIKQINGYTVIDDSYNANPASMSAALDVLDSQSGTRRVFCCGDMGELGENTIELHSELGRKIASSKTDILITAGPLSKNTAQAAIDAGFKAQHAITTENSQQAAEKLLEIIMPGDTVLTKGSRSAKMEKIVERLNSK